MEKGADTNEFGTNRLGCVGKYRKLEKRIGIDEMYGSRSRCEMDKM